MFVGDTLVVFESTSFCIVICADDLNSFKACNRGISNAVIIADLRVRKDELHKWGRAKRVTFDASK